jgi:hypothetical protein
VNCPCAAPPLPADAACSAEIAGPNQHSATRYESARRAMARGKVGADTVRYQRGAARREAAAGTSSLERPPLARPSAMRPPENAESAPMRETMSALTTA